MKGICSKCSEGEVMCASCCAKKSLVCTVIITLLAFTAGVFVGKKVGYHGMFYHMNHTEAQFNEQRRGLRSVVDKQVQKAQMEQEAATTTDADEATSTDAL